MPRQPRLDAPGTLHHVMLRGIARGQIVADREDREAFLQRLGEVAIATETTVYAWALLPNHAHLLLRSGPRDSPGSCGGSSPAMPWPITATIDGPGISSKNRYKSIVVEEDTYFRELVRYIHLNPLRANLVPDLPHLDRYPWCGHAGLLGRDTPPWQDRAHVLAWFGQRERPARRAYRAYLRDGIPQGRRLDLVGGGLIRSLGGWAEVAPSASTENGSGRTSASWAAARSWSGCSQKGTTGRAAGRARDGCKKPRGSSARSVYGTDQG